MSETIEVVAEHVPVEKKQSFVQDVFGQLRTAAFWVDLLKVVISEAVNAFMMAFGGVLMYYGSQRRDTKIATMTSMATGGTVASPIANKAFGNAYQPTPSYSPSTSYPVPVQPTGDARFPGFGGPR